MPTLSPAQIGAYAKAAGFTGQWEFLAVATAEAESSGNTDAVSSNPNGGYNVGLMQLNTRGGGAGYSVAELKDPATNMRVAHAVWQRDGQSFTKEWETWHNGKVTQAAGELIKQGFSQQYASQIGNGASAIINGGGNFMAESGNAAAQAAGSLPGIGALSGVTAIAADIDKTGKWITTPSNWVRILFVVGGAVLLIAGAAQLARPVTDPLAKGAAKAGMVLA